MNEIFKRAISLLLVLVMVASILPVSALAEGETEVSAPISATEETTAPTSSIPEPTEGTTAPPKEETEPVKAPTAPSEAPTAPSEAVTEPSSEPTEPTEEATEPTEGTTAPTEAETEPTEDTTVPTEEVLAVEDTALLGIALSEGNFPDAAFRSYLASEFDGDADGYLSEDEQKDVWVISVDAMGITSLKGIELLPGVMVIWCSDNQLTSLDVSKNTSLDMLYCNNNRITELDLRKNVNLQVLQCSNNGLTKLDVSNCSKLQSLWADYNNLTSVDVSNCLALESLDLTDNQLTSLDISRNTALTSLRFGGAQMGPNRLTEEVDVSHLPLLEDLVFYYTNIERVDVSNNPLLSYLYCPCNELTELVLGNNTKLESLICYQNDLTVLDLTGCTGLTTITASENQLTSLDVSNCAALTNLYAYYNQYTIFVDSSRKYDLKNLPGNFDVTRVEGLTGGESVISVPKNQDTYCYNYDCGNGYIVPFTLLVEEYVPKLEIGYMKEGEFVPWKSDGKGTYQAENFVSYGGYEVKAYLDIHGTGLMTDVTADCVWTSEDEEKFYVELKYDKAEGSEPGEEGALSLSQVLLGCLEENAGEVLLQVTYNKDGVDATCDCPLTISNLSIPEGKESLLEYAALSHLTYTIFPEQDRGLSVKQMLKKGTKVYSWDGWISGKASSGATFGSLYAAAIENWVLIDQKSADGGFDVTRFRNANGYEVIAYRGTEAQAETIDLWKDICLGLGNQCSQLQDGVKYYDEVVKEIGADKILLVTGHSLGGGIANYVSLLRGVKAVTFNAPSTMVSAIVADSKEMAMNFRGLNDGLRTDYVNPLDGVGNTGVGDNAVSTRTSNFSFVFNITTVNADLGGLIDRTVFCIDQSSVNGKGEITPHHYFNQLLDYDIEEGTITITLNGETTNPNSLTFTLRDKDYALGSTGDDTLSINKEIEGRAHGSYVFAGEGNDDIRVYTGSSFHALSNDGVFNRTVDLVSGGKGNDVIDSSSLGSLQTYIYSKGDGYDEIYDYHGNDTIQLYGMEKNSIRWNEYCDEYGIKFYDIYQNETHIMRISQNGVGAYTLRLDDEVIGKLVKNRVTMNIFTAHCPVDMEIYDPSNKLVLTLKDGQPMDSYRAYGHFSVELEGEEYAKTAIFFEDGYYFKLVGTGTGTMEYSVSVVDEAGAETRVAYEIPVQAGAVYTVPENTEQVILQGDLNNDGTIDYEAIPLAPESITLNQTSAELNVKETLQLTAAVNPSDAHQGVYWQSSDSGIASVDQTGKVTAQDVGTAKITVMSEENSAIMAQCTVTVQDPAIQVTGVAVSASQFLKGESVTLTAQYTGTGDPAGTIWTIWPMEYVDGNWIKGKQYIYRSRNLTSELTYKFTRLGWFTATVEVTNENDRITSATSEIFEVTEKICEHSFAVDPAKEPTCTTTGLTEGSHCELCGTVRGLQKEIAALGHLERRQEDKDPTCTEAGHIGSTDCKRCGQILTQGQVLPALGHAGVKHRVPETPYTDTTPGNKAYDIYLCSRCGVQVDKKNRELTEAEIAQIIEANATYPETRSIHLTLDGENVAGAKKDWELSTQGNQVKLNVSYEPSAAKPKLAWSSSSKGTATVENGTVTFGKPGTVKITAKATDGSGLSAAVTFNVTYKDPAKRFTGKLAPSTNLYKQPSKNGLQVRDSVDILVYGSDNTKPLEYLTYEIISGEEFASLEGNTVTALVPGKTVKVKAYWEGDPLKRSYTATIKTKATIPGEMRIDRGALVMKDEFGYILSDGFLNTDDLPVLLVAKGSAEKKFSITLKAWDQDGRSMEDDNGVIWSTSSSKIATVKEDKNGIVTITVKKNVGGEATITAKSKLDKTVVTTMTVRVVDYVPRLSAKSVTVNTALVDASMTIPLVWENADDVETVEFVDKKGNAVSGITVSYAPKQSAFVVNNPEIAMKNGSYAGKLRIQTRTGQKVELAFTVKLVNKAPAVTIKQTKKLNLLDPHSFAEYTISSKQGTVNRIALSQDIQLISSGSNNQFRLDYAEEIGDLLKTDVRGKVDIYVDGYKNPVNKTLNVGTERVKNKAVLGSGTIILYTSQSGAQAVTALNSYFVGQKVDDCTFSTTSKQGQKIQVICKEGIVTASFLNPADMPKNGIYTFTAIPTIQGESVAKVTLKVKVATAP